MADGSFSTPISKDRDANLIGNPVFVQISDGTEILLVNADGSINVSNTANYAEDSVAGNGDTGTFILAVRRDADAATCADGDYSEIQTDENGFLKVAVLETVGGGAAGGIADDSAFTIGTDLVSPNGFLADETAPDSVDEGDIGIARMTLDRKQLTVLVDATTDSQRLAINASGEAQVDVAAHALTNANALPVSANNTANSATNPIYVYQTQDVVASTEVHDYDTAAAVASDATDNHDYTVTGTTFLLKSVIVSGSGNIKFEIQTGPLASLATVAVGFLTGRQGDTKQVTFDPPVEVPVTSTGTVRIIRTNRQGAATDLYSTIIGNDV